MIVAVLMIGQVSAADLNESDTITIDENINSQDVISTTHTPKNYTDLKNSIENAADGDIIELNGTYEIENTITITKSIEIVGVDDVTIKEKLGEYKKFNFFIIDSSVSNVVLKNLKFQDHPVSVNGNYAKIINCAFDGISEGALNIAGSNCNITNSTFTNNKAINRAGGAISVSGDNCIVDNCIFSENEARGSNGGAIFISADNCIVQNSNFTLNYCGVFGGAIAVSGNNNRISNSKFEKNYIKTDLNTTRGGGAIFSDSNGLNINGCEFNDNNASAALGGAVVLGENNRVEYSFFKGNNALIGNDIYSNKTAYVFYNTIILDYNESRNQSIYGDKLTLLDNAFDITKIDSKITFNAGMVFEYGSYGEIHVIVEGGSISKENITVLNHPEATISFVNSILKVSGLAVGNYVLRVTTTPDKDHNSIEKDLPVTVKKATAVIKASKVTVAYKKGSLWQITVVDSKSGKPIANMKLTMKVFTGKKYKTVEVTTNSKGVATYQTRKLAKGTHKIVVSGSHPGYNFNTLSSSIKVIKQKKLTFKVKKRVDKDGSSISITTKCNNKRINGVKLNLYVYKGKKIVKKVVLKTKTKGKFKGVCGWGTNKISVGNNKIVITPDNIKYYGSKTIKLKLKKSSKKYISWESKI